MIPWQAALVTDVIALVVGIGIGVLTGAVLVASSRRPPER